MPRLNVRKLLPPAVGLAVIGLTAASFSLTDRGKEAPAAPISQTVAAESHDDCCAAGHETHAAGEACEHEKASGAEACEHTQGSAAAQPEADGLPVTRAAGRLRVTLDSPEERVQVGRNRFTIRLTDSGGKPVRDASVRVTFSMPGMDHGDTPVTAAPQGDGAYALRGDLAMPGAWQATAAVTRPGQPAVTATLGFQAGKRGPISLLTAEGEAACPYGGAPKQD